VIQTDQIFEHAEPACAIPWDYPPGAVPDTRPEPWTSAASPYAQHDDEPISPRLVAGLMRPIPVAVSPLAEESAS
jgi:hypothetical protein